MLVTHAFSCYSFVTVRCDDNTPIILYHKMQNPQLCEAIRFVGRTVSLSALRNGNLSNETRANNITLLCPNVLFKYLK